MSAQTSPRLPPSKILLATDLSARGDRALDRAAQLARQWDAHLLIVHAMEPGPATTAAEFFDPLPSWRRPPLPAPAVERRIRRDLREAVDRLTVHVEEGDPAQVILDTAEREGCDLIILGEAGDGAGRMSFGSTTGHLVRRSPVSILIVKTRPNGPYKHVLAGTDFTEESRYGLEVASAAFPDSLLTVMHAFEMPYRSLLHNSTLGHDFAAMEKAAMQDFINEADLTERARAGILTTIEHGPPELMLGRYVEERHADLTVIGAYGRGRLFHLLIRGTAPRIIDSVPGDVLLVRARRPEAATAE